MNLQDSFVIRKPCKQPVVSCLQEVGIAVIHLTPYTLI